MATDEGYDFKIWVYVIGLNLPFKVPVKFDTDVDDLAKKIVATLQQLGWPKTLTMFHLVLYRVELPANERIDEAARMEVKKGVRITELGALFPKEPGQVITIVVDLSAGLQPPPLFTTREDGKVTPPQVPNRGFQPTTSQKPREIIKSGIEKLLDKYRPKLEAYLKGEWDDPLLGYLTPLTSTSKRSKIDDHISQLRLPVIPGQEHPSLLLHGLGTLSDTSDISRVFRDGTLFVINTSGAGKTRLLLDGLCYHWGFYFACVSEKAQSSSIGSSDMSAAINQVMRQVKSLDTVPDATKSAVLVQNRALANRRFRRLLKARTLVFDWFLDSLPPGGAAEPYRRHWLMLQLLPGILGPGSDIFRRIDTVLSGADDEYLTGDLNTDLQQVWERLVPQTANGAALFFVLDEAQIANRELKKAFASSDNESPRPVLREILLAWDDSYDPAPIIVSGTGIGYETMMEVKSSSVLKGPNKYEVNNVAISFTRDTQAAYLKRFLFGEMCTPELLELVWNWLAGRPRFTASFIEAWLGQLFSMKFFPEGRPPQEAQILEQVRDTSTLLHEYVEQATDPSQQLGPIAVNPIRAALNTLVDNAEHHDIARHVQRVVYKWMLLRTVQRLDKYSEKLIELGFARYLPSTIDRGKIPLIDEPLVFWAAARYFETVPQRGYKLEDFIANSLLDGDAGRGANFEVYIMNYLRWVFNGEHNLSDVIDFGPDGPPDWAKQPASLIRVGERDRTQPIVEHYTLCADPTGTYGCRSTSIKETIRWLANPTSAFLFPDPNMGPDIVGFIQLQDGRRVLLVFQIKWLGKTSMGEKLFIHALKTVDPTLFWAKERLKDETIASARKAFQSLLDDVTTPPKKNKGPPDLLGDKHLALGQRVLRLLAIHPAQVSKQVSVHGDLKLLNMEYLLKKSPRGGLFRHHRLGGT